MRIMGDAATIPPTITIHIPPISLLSDDGEDGEASDGVGNIRGAVSIKVCNPPPPLLSEDNKI